jgi:serine protease Do
MPFQTSVHSRIVAAVTMTVLALAGSPAMAQLRSDQPSVMTPSGRAPISFADIVERVKPAVVSIDVTGAQPKVAQQAPNQKGQRGSRALPDGIPELPEDHPLHDFFKNLPRGGGAMPNPRPALGKGSGFVISADGFVVTNNHVIDNGAKIQVSFDEDNKFEADLIGTDPRTDIALLKIKNPTKPLPFVKFAAKDPRVGDWVLAVGNPFGLGGTVTAGIVSALGRDIGSGPYDFLQIDAAVNRGNSGGPTFNLDGEVVGVNTAIFSPSGGNVGIAFAVPARTAGEVIEQLRSTGSVSRGWLGVKIQNIDEELAASLGLPKGRGALINEVTAGGPAAEAGLKTGDAVLTVDGEPINDSRDLARKVAKFAPNSRVDVKVMRGGKEQSVAVKLGNFPSPKETAKLEQPKPAAAEPNQLGLTLVQPTAAKGTREGVAIAEVQAGSDAAQKNLRAGDIILEVNSQPVTSPEEVNKAVAEAMKAGRAAVLLRIKSGNDTRFVGVRPTAKKG